MLYNTKDAHRTLGFAAGGTRPKGDFYATPKEATLGLLGNMEFGNLILGPACGNGAISKILQDTGGYTVISQDLYDWGYGVGGVDFTDCPIVDVDAVITNPPFKYSSEFAYKALSCTKSRLGKVALLNRVQWLEGIKRKKLFQETPLSKVLVFSRRIPRMHRFDHEGKTSTNMIAFAWFIFDWKHTGPPMLGWI